MSKLSQHNARIIDAVYDDDVALRLSIRKGVAPAFIAELTEITRGNLAVKYLSPLTQTK